MSDRIKCTKDNPSDGTPYKWFHPDAVPVDSVDYFCGESYDTYKCPHCGIEFTVEVSQ